MESNRSMPQAQVIPELAYPDVGAAALWLSKAFGFSVRLRIGAHRAQLEFGRGALILRTGPAPAADESTSHSVMVRVDNVDEHHAKAVSAGAKVSGPPTTHPYGERQYAAQDIGGHWWVFSQTVEDVSPSQWGGELVGSQNAFTSQQEITMPIDTLAIWHELVTAQNAKGLSALLADDVVFHSPVVHSPQVGKSIATKYLAAAFHVFYNQTFKYVREVVGPRDAVLEFQVEIDGIVVNGVDMIKWNDDGRVVDFKVMVRPLKAINLIHQKMGAMLQAQQQ